MAIDALTAAVHAAVSAISSLSSKVAGLKSEVADLKAEIAAHAVEHEGEQALADELNAAIAAIPQD